MMSVEVNNEKAWLVKSAGLILGPFSIEDVILSLKEQKISPIDEIRQPDGRWSFIREHPQFVEVIQFLRDHDRLKKEDTDILNSATITMTGTSGVNFPITGDVHIDGKKEDIPDLTDEAAQALESAHAKIPTYAFRSDQKVQRSILRSRKKAAWIAWLALALIVFGLFTFQQRREKDSPKSLNSADYLRLAKSSKNIGQYEKALEFYRKAETLGPMPTASRLQMISLMMLVENQNVQARQYLEQILSNNEDQSLKDEVESYLALSCLREGRLDEAQKRYEAFTLKDSTKEFAKMNLAEILLLKEQFELAYQSLTELLKTGFKESTLTFYRTLALYRSPPSPTNDEKLSTALEDLKRYLSTTQDFKLEVLLLTTAIQSHLGKSAEAEDLVQEMLNMDPDLTRKHIHDELIHREVLEWKYLGQICNDILDKMPVSAASMGLKALCSYQQSDLKSALEQIEKARTQFSSESVLYGLQSFLLVKSGRSSEASAIWQLAKADENHLLILVQAQFCMEQKNWDCAETQWKKLLSQEKNDIEANYGLAKISWEQGKRDQALDYIQQGLLVSKNYRPLVILKDQINEP